MSALDSSFETTTMEHDPQDENTGFNSKAHASKSNAMRRILGLDGTGLLNTIQRTRTISNVGSVFKARPNNSLPGLGNWDNSCYQNSVLQGLAALESLPTFLQSNTPETSGPTQKALNETIARLNDPANAGKTFWTPAELKSMSSWQQQDAQEYFSKLSDELEKDNAKAAMKRFGDSGLQTLLRVKQSEKRTTPDSTPQTKSLTSPKDAARVQQIPEELASLIVRNPLEGLLAQRVGCTQCDYVEGLSLVPFNCLTVPLGTQWMYDVRSCLDEYTALEPINGVECAKCTLLRAKEQMQQLLSRLLQNIGEGGSAQSETANTLRLSLRERLDRITQALENENFSEQVLKNCQIPSNKRVSTTKTRQAVIARSPKSLVIHVNRSNFDELTGVQSKNSATVRFPQQLDLAPWCLGCDPSVDNKDEDIETWNVDPSKSMLSTEYCTEGLDSGKLYELRAVITHYGRHENGHYICYRQSPYSGKANDKEYSELSTCWWRLSDEDVAEVDESTVLAQGGVFMLFYEQIASLPPQEEPQLVFTELKQDLQAKTEEVQRQPSQAVDEAEVPILDDNECAESVLKDLSSSSEEPAHLASPPNPTENAQLEAPAANGQELLGPENIKPAASIDVPPQSLSQASPNTPMLDTLGASTNSSTGARELKTVARPASPDYKETSVSVVSVHPTIQDDTHKENQHITPLSMRTASPRSSRGSGSRAGKAMGTVAGYVQAN